MSVVLITVLLERVPLYTEKELSYAIGYYAEQALKYPADLQYFEAYQLVITEQARRVRER